MKQTTKIKVDKLFENGKTYRMKILDWRFTLTRDPYKRDKDGNILGIHNTIWGIYWNEPNLGVCPISPERLIPETELVDNEIEICDNCNQEIIK